MRVKHLMFSKIYIPLLLTGRKTATIRLKHPGVKPGDTVLIHAGGKIIAKAIVKEVRRIKLEQVTDELARMEGFSSAKELINALCKHYPRLSERKPVYLVIFEVTEKFDKFLDEHKEAWPYEETPQEVAEIALRHLELDENEKKVLLALAREGSIRRAALRLGDIKLRHLVRGVLRKTAVQLEEKGLLHRTNK